MKALEHLAAAQQPLSLSGLSRAIEVGPSSLLAILTTLRGAGLVSRSARDGRYVPGPGLVALGSAAAQRLEPLQTFDVLAADLVERLGETVLLWIQQGDGLAMAAAREGTQPLRYVPPLGLRLPASGWAGGAAEKPSSMSVAAPLGLSIDRSSAALPLGFGLFGRTPSGSQVDVVEGELEPGVWMLAASLDERAMLAVVGPAGRLCGASGASARQMLGTVVGGGGVWTGSGPIGPDELDGFLTQALVASLSYLSDDGYPASVPLWYDWDGSAFWLVPSPGAEWAQHVRRNPRVSLSVSESTPPLRRVLARGPILAVDDPDAGKWRSVEGRLAARYARLDAARLLEGRSGQPRVLLRLVPERLIAWRGLLRPVATSGAPAVAHEAAVPAAAHLA